MIGPQPSPAQAPQETPVALEAQGRGSFFEVLLIFARLGCTSFGGPVAHLAYFRTEFVERRRWLSERAYADLVGLCQFLPGPGSSKMGFSLGLMRAGYPGGLAAWIGFTLPSAIALVLFAFGADSLSQLESGQALLHGLKLVAVSIVAQAVLGMARNLAPDRPRASIAVLATALVVFAPTAIGQIVAIVVGALLGLRFCRSDKEAVPEAIHVPVSKTVGTICLVIFGVLLLLSFAPLRESALGMFNAFYRSGALVFGGGHVVLPLLRESVVVPGWVDDATFLAGYGAAQAAPGPLFTFAAFLGAAASRPVTGFTGATIATIAIFLPGMLLQLGALPFWNALRGKHATQAAMRGVNAAVVGILAAALYNPVWTSAIGRPADFVVALAGFVLLVVWKAPALLVVALTAVGGAAVALWL